MGNTSQLMGHGNGQSGWKLEDIFEQIHSYVPRATRDRLWPSTTVKANMPLTPDCLFCNLRRNERILYILSIPSSLQRQKS